MRTLAPLLCLLASCTPAEPTPIVNVAPPTSTLTASSSEPARPAPPRPSSTLDASKLTAREKHDLDESLSQLLAPCKEVPVTLGQCIQEERPCKACVPAGRFLLKQVLAGRDKREREASFHARFDADKIKTVPTDDSPTFGDASAFETIVVWADFECPFCRMIEPLLEEAVRRAPGRARVVFKLYPLQMHPHADAAARAAVAAKAQGKFLEMSHQLFEHQDKLEAQDLEGYATAIGLDLKKFRKDAASKATTDVIARDVKEADDLNLQGTPFIFFNGRELDPAGMTSDLLDDLVDWISVDLELAGLAPLATPPKR